MRAQLYLNFLSAFQAEWLFHTENTVWTDTKKMSTHIQTLGGSSRDEDSEVFVSAK